MHKNVIYQSDQGVVSITLNRGDKRNAFNAEMITEIKSAFQKASEDEKARVLVLKGHGKSFSAGADLAWMKKSMEFSFEDNQNDAKELRQMYLALQQVPYPVVGLVHGHVMGGALGLVALCDIVAAEQDTRFCFSEVKLGLAPAVVSEFVQGKINPSAMARFFLSAEIFKSPEAEKMGLVHHIGTMEEAQSFVQQTVKRLCENGPVATRATKALVRALNPNNQPVDSITVPLIAKLRTGEEGQEGLQAFFEKRDPSWRNL